MRTSSNKLTRRKALQALTGGVVCAAAGPSLFGMSRASAEDEPNPSERAAMADVALEFMRRFDVPGLSVALANHGGIVYESAFGESNRQTRQRLSVKSLFRIASVTKPITSTAIFTLVERGRIAQHDRVFGPGAVLGTKFGKPPYTRWIADITVDHLLTHTCGGWDNSNDDPMFQKLGMDHAQLIAWTLETKPLKFVPGTHYAYSNFGYSVLGRVIEEITRRPYHEFVQEEILSRCGIRDMRIAGNTLQERFPEEVIYSGQNGENPYDMNLARMDSHGGWLATARDLVMFLNHVDGFKFTPSLLKPETIKLMTTPSSATLTYARGWAVNSVPNWWHNGSLPGTTTIMVRTASGFCWAALTNTRRAGQPDMGLALDNMVWDMVRKVSTWSA